MGMSDEAGAEQYHIDPATYLAMMLAEVPAYRDLQHHLAEATRGIDAGTISTSAWERRNGIGGAGCASRCPPGGDR
jgi:hypothetical protein